MITCPKNSNLPLKETYGLRMSYLCTLVLLSIFKVLKRKIYISIHISHKYPPNYSEEKASSQGQQVTGSHEEDEFKIMTGSFSLKSKHLQLTTKPVPEFMSKMAILSDWNTLNTGMYLMTHNIASPLTSTNQEVTATDAGRRITKIIKKHFGESSPRTIGFLQGSQNLSWFMWKLKQVWWIRRRSAILGWGSKRNQRREVQERVLSTYGWLRKLRNREIQYQGEPTLLSTKIYSHFGKN